MTMIEELQCSGADFYELGKDLVGSGHTLRFAVGGRSMFPFLRDGDIIQVAPSSITGLRLGDIIFYRSGERLLAHRVVGFVTTSEGRCARARGDAFLQEDAPVAEAELIGRVESLSRQFRDGWHQISLNRGWMRVAGAAVARSRAAHRCLRWLSRAWLRWSSLPLRWQRASSDRPESSVAEAEEHNS